jgi:hypothetical protein
MALTLQLFKEALITKKADDDAAAANRNANAFFIETLLILVTPSRRRLRGIRRRRTSGAVARFKHRSARRAELRGVRLQTSHDPIFVGDRRPA